MPRGGGLDLLAGCSQAPRPESGGGGAERSPGATPAGLALHPPPAPRGRAPGAGGLTRVLQPRLLPLPSPCTLSLPPPCNSLPLYSQSSLVPALQGAQKGKLQAAHLGPRVSRTCRSRSRLLWHPPATRRIPRGAAQSRPHLARSFLHLQDEEPLWVRLGGS